MAANFYAPGKGRGEAHARLATRFPTRHPSSLPSRPGCRTRRRPASSNGARARQEAAAAARRPAWARTRTRTGSTSSTPRADGSSALRMCEVSRRAACPRAARWHRWQAESRPSDGPEWVWTTGELSDSSTGRVGGRLHVARARVGRSSRACRERGSSARVSCARSHSQIAGEARGILTRRRSTPFGQKRASVAPFCELVGLGWPVAMTGARTGPSALRESGGSEGRCADRVECARNHLRGGNASSPLLETLTRSHRLLCLDRSACVYAVLSRRGLLVFETGEASGLPTQMVR